jgi:hypothetical protein
MLPLTIPAPKPSSIQNSQSQGSIAAKRGPHPMGHRPPAARPTSPTSRHRLAAWPRPPCKHTRTGLCLRPGGHGLVARGRLPPRSAAQARGLARGSRRRMASSGPPPKAPCQRSPPSRQQRIGRNRQSYSYSPMLLHRHLFDRQARASPQKGNGASQALGGGATGPCSRGGVPQSGQQLAQDLRRVCG